MKICLWNCRGLKKLNRWTEINALCKTEHFQMIALVEIKCPQLPAPDKWTKAGFDSHEFVPSIGMSGGLLIVWKNHQLVNESIKTFHKEDRFVAFKYTNLDNHKELVVIMAYAPPKAQEKNLFWNKLKLFINQV